jgi:hypothetical protein
MTVAELGQRMSSHELSEWKAFYIIEPFGEERADIRQALTTQGIYNVHQAQRKHPKWHKVEEFMPFKEKAEPVTDAEDPEVLKGKLLAFAGKRQATG